MSVQLSDLIQHVSMGSVERAVGPGAFMVIRTGPAPEDTDEPDAGLILAVIELPDGWVSAAKGAHSVGPWGKFRARTTGTAGHFRIYANDGECCVQGRITADGDGGDVTLNILDYVPGRSGEITSFAFWKAEGQKPDRLRAKRIRILKARARKAGIPWLEGEDPPAGGNDLKSIIDGLGLGTGLICCLDAGTTDSYPGTGQTWFDLTTNNADFYLGTDGDVNADDPVFSGVAGALTAAEKFGTNGRFAQVANFGAQNFHKAGQAFSIAMVVYFATAEATVYLFSTRSPGVFLFQFEGAIGVGIDDGSAAPEQTSAASIAGLSGYHFIGVSFDRAGGATGCVLAINDITETYDVSFAGTPSSEDGGLTLVMGSSDADAEMGTDAYVNVCGIWNRALTPANFVALYAALKTTTARFPALNVATAP